jgi:hypothetical protein
MVLSPEERAIIENFRARGGQNAQQQRQQQQPQGVNIDGRWEFGDGVWRRELVFDGDSVTEYRYNRIFAEKEISQAELDSGAVTAWIGEVDSWGTVLSNRFVGVENDIGVQREVVSVEPWVANHERVTVDGVTHSVEDLDWVTTIVRERRQGTFVAVPRGREIDIEFLWEDTARGENGWERVNGWERTVNALAPDKLRNAHWGDFTFVE